MVASESNHAIKQLIRAFLMDEGLADEFAADLVESGDCQGMMGEQVLRRVYESRRRGERIEVTKLTEPLSPEERRMVYESLFWPGDAPTREVVRAYCQALRRSRATRDQAKLRVAIEDAIRQQDYRKLAELKEANAKLDKELRRVRRV
jgi:hypothetical protein